MGPQPKRKISKGRRDRRRAHDSISTPNLVNCDNCNSRRIPHRVCPSCGHYRGREVLLIKDDLPKSS